MMTRQSENVQPSLFNEAPHVVLAAAQMADLSVLIDALHREIAAALANGEIGNEQDHA
jgi:hypothetical protein